MKVSDKEFKTAFLTESGAIITNKQYFNFIEKDGWGCWILAEQLDSSEEKRSAQLAAEQLLQDFLQKPTFSRKKIKAYLDNAHRKLVAESGTIMLKAGLVMLVSDYSKLVWAVSGNVRCYHFRGGCLSFRSKDQTLAQVMLDAGNISEEDINRRNERNGLINYLGITTEYKPEVSQAVKLQDGDKILLCNIGLWETLNISELTTVMAGTEEPVELLDKLKAVFMEKTKEQPKQFIASVIAIKRVSKRKTVNYLTNQSVVALLIILFLVVTGWLVNYKRSQINLTLKDSVETIRKKDQAAGDRMIDRNETSAADNLDKQKEIDQTVISQQTETEINPTESTGLAGQNKERNEAPTEDKIKALMNRQDTEEQNNVKAEAMRRQREAEERKREAEVLRRQQETEERKREAEALKEQRKAAEQKNRGNESVEPQVPRSDIVPKSNISRETEIQAKYNQAQALEQTGDARYDSQNYNEALDLYKQARQIYSSLGMAQEVARIEQKINITINKKLEHFLKRLKK